MVRHASGVCIQVNKVTIATNVIRNACLHILKRPVIQGELNIELSRL